MRCTQRVHVRFMAPTKNEIVVVLEISRKLIMDTLDLVVVFSGEGNGSITVGQC